MADESQKTGKDWQCVGSIALHVVGFGAFRRVWFRKLNRSIAQLTPISVVIYHLVVLSLSCPCACCVCSLMLGQSSAPYADAFRKPCLTGTALNAQTLNFTKKQKDCFRRCAAASGAGLRAAQCYYWHWPRQLCQCTLLIAVNSP